MLGSTYSLFGTSNVDEDLNVYKTGNLDVSYTLSSGNVVLSNIEPMSEEEADGITPYRMRVINNGTVPYQFDVSLVDTTATDVIDYQYIMTKVGYLGAKPLSECTDKVIKDNVVVQAGESVDIDIRVYLSEDLPNSEIGKSFYAKLAIDGLAVYSENEDIDNSVLSLVYMKTSSTSDIRSSTYIESIKSASFVDYIDTSNAVATFDMTDTSMSPEGTVMAWLQNNSSGDGYDLYIGSKQKIYVTNLIKFFDGMIGLEDIKFDNLDTSLTTDMTSMFENCSSIVNLDLSSFDTSNVIYMNVPGYYSYGGMFSGCTSLETLDISSFDTSNITLFGNMFRNCSKLTNLDLSSFDTSRATDMGGMFENCKNLLELDLSSFDTSNVTDMMELFYGCSSLESIDLGGFDTSNVNRMDGLFYGCSSLTSLDLSGFDTSNVTRMNNMFRDCSQLFNLDLSGFNTRNVINMSQMFYNCRNIIELNLSNFDTQNVTLMTGMFYKCILLEKLNVSSFNTSNVTSMSSMFYGCSSLINLDLNNFDTSKVTAMNSMFYNCNKLITVLIIRNNFETTYNSMFQLAATSSGAKITINYAGATSSLVDSMLETKSSNSNVVKGSLVS